MGAPSRTPTRGRKFVALHVRMLADTDLLVCSDAARLLWPLLLLHTAEQGLEGLVPADPRRINLFAHLSGGVDATRDALAELVAGRFLIADPDGDGARLLIRTWDANQVDFGGSGTRAVANAAASLRQWHLAGKHTTVRDGCQLCAAGLSVADTAPVIAAAPLVPATVAVVAVQDTLPVLVPPAASEGMREVLADVRASLDVSIPGFPTPFGGYVSALAEADDLAVAVGHLSKDARAALRNAVLGHALVSLLGERATQSVINAANRGAKALGDTGHQRYVFAAVECAQVAFDTDRGAIAYLAKVAKGDQAYAAAAGKGAAA